ncbi:putative RNA-directed DNA polymerase [Tanacetum coccineum]
MIDPGIREPAVGIAQSEAEKKKLEELRMKDLQVKHYLYQAIDRVTFEQILDRKTSKAVWESMKRRFAGNDRVKKSMLQKLRRDFEVLEMKTNETIPEYFGRVLMISNQMRSNGESMTDVKIVEKILRTLTEKYIYVVVSIEESKDIDQMSIEELQSTLIVHEQKFKKVEQEEEQALKVDAGDSSNTRGRGRGRYSYRGRGRGRGRQSFNKETIECYNCHKLGHYSYECPNAKEANYAGFDENEEIMLMADGGVEENGFMAQIKSENKGLLWFLDSGCSNHMCGNKERFVDLDESFSNTVKLGNNTRMTVEGKGSMKLVLNEATYVIKDVYYVPELKNNLLSIGQLQQKGLSFLFQSDLCKVFHPGRGLIFQSRMSTNRMYPLSEDANETTEQKADECMYSSDDDIAKLWHERLGHISKTGMKTLQHKRMVRDLPEFIVDTSVCEDCMIGKQTKEAIPKSSSWRAGEILELVHSDICGPITPTSHAGKKYFLSFIDDYSRKGWVYFLTEKSQAFESFKDFKSKVETETGKVVKALRTDRGGEYLSNEFSEFCRKHGIKRQLTTSFTPQQNGVAERKNRTVINMVVTLLSAKNMPKIFWAEATAWSFYVLNRSTTKALSDVTPQEAWSGLKPTVNHF